MFTSIHSYAMSGNLVRLKQEIEKQLQGNTKEIGDIIDLSTGSGDTPLLISVMAAQVEIVTYLIDQGANLWVYNKNKDTVLHVAITEIMATSSEERWRVEKLYEIIKIILQKELGLLYIPGCLGKTPWDIANSKHPRCLEFESKARLLKIIKEINPTHPLIRNEQKIVKEAEEQKESIFSPKEASDMSFPLLQQLRHRHALPKNKQKQSEDKTKDVSPCVLGNQGFCCVQ